MDKVVIVGAGAMGSLFASHLAGAAGETWVYDVRRDHVATIRDVGLKVRRDGGEEVIGMRATTDPNEPGVADLVLLFVKFDQTRQAAADILPAIGASTVVLTLQNGLGNVEVIREIVPDNPILYGFTTLTSELLGPGVIEASYAGRGDTFVWPVGGAPDSRCEAVVDLFNNCGIHTTLDSGIELRIWQKLVVNCCLNTLCAVTGLSVGDLVDQAEVWPVLNSLTDEIVDVASHKGIDLDRDEAHRFLRDVAVEARAHYPSMLKDVRAEKPTEIECLNGAVLREAERLGLDAPYNRCVYGMIRVLENTYAHRRGS